MDAGGDWEDTTLSILSGLSGSGGGELVGDGSTGEGDSAIIGSGGDSRLGDRDVDGADAGVCLVVWCGRDCSRSGADLGDGLTGADSFGRAEEIASGSR